jgi:hypothetical protein
MSRSLGPMSEIAHNCHTEAACEKGTELIRS